MPSPVRSIEVENLMSGRRFLIQWALNSITESITTYEIWRSTTEYQGFQKIASVPSPMTQYIDKVPFTFGIVYFYKVIARDNTGLGSDLHQTPAVQDSTFDDFEEAPFRSTSVAFSNFVIGEIPVLTVNVSSPPPANTYTLANFFRFNTVQIFVNGLSLIRNTDFTENVDQQTVTLMHPVVGTISVNYITV